ncbi:MAG: hypothetical protein V9G22_15820 [Ottowia sp.]
MCLELLDRGIIRRRLLRVPLDLGDAVQILELHPMERVVQTFVGGELLDANARCTKIGFEGPGSLADRRARKERAQRRETRGGRARDRIRHRQSGRLAHELLPKREDEGVTRPLRARSYHEVAREARGLGRLYQLERARAQWPRGDEVVEPPIEPEPDHLLESVPVERRAQRRGELFVLRPRESHRYDACAASESSGGPQAVPARLMR